MRGEDAAASTSPEGLMITSAPDFDVLSGKLVRGMLEQLLARELQLIRVDREAHVPSRRRQLFLDRLDVPWPETSRSTLR
jgi:hypothetical protein